MKLFFLHGDVGAIMNLFFLLWFALTLGLTLVVRYIYRKRIPLWGYIVVFILIALILVLITRVIFELL